MSIFPYLVGGQFVLGAASSVFGYFENQDYLASQQDAQRDNMAFQYKISQMKWDHDMRMLEKKYSLMNELKEESTGGGAPPQRFYEEGSIHGNVLA